MSNAFPRFGNFLSSDKLSGSFSLSSSGKPSILLSIFPIKFDKSCRVSSLFRNLILSQLNHHLFFLPSDLPCYLCSPIHAVLRSLISQFQNLHLVLFYNFNFFGKEFLFNNFILEFIKLPEFSCSWLDFFITAILNSHSLRYQYSVSLSLVARELSFSFCKENYHISFIFHSV